MRRSTSVLASVLIVAIVVIAAAVGVYYALHLPSSQAPPKVTPVYPPAVNTTGTSTGVSGISTSTTPYTTTVTTSLQDLTLSEIESSLNLSAVASLGPSNASKVIVIFYDPECPYCALELNATLPFLYYISQNTSQARVIFIGIPIHEYSYPMLEILQAVYQRYGPTAFATLLDANYAYYVYLIELYESGVLSSFEMPNVTTLVFMADHLGYNVSQAEVNAQNSTVYDMYEFAVTHGVTGTPTIVAYNSTGAPVFIQVGLENPSYLVGNLTERLGLKLPS